MKRGNRGVSRRRMMALVVALGAMSVSTAWLAATFVAPPVAQAQNAADHLANAETLYEQQRYAEALTEVNAALAENPTSFQARTLKGTIEAKLAAAPATTNPATTAAAPATKPAPKKELLTPTQVTHIQLEEMSNAEIKNATGGLPRKDLDTFWREYMVGDTNVNQLNNARIAFEKPTNFPDQLLRIRNHSAYSTMDKLHIDGVPAAIMTFAAKVQPYVLQKCATSACHGGKDLMAMPLFRNAQGPSRETYTNFYILSMSHTSDGGFVLDRNNPDQSALIQYMLKPANARIHHPGKVVVPNPFVGLDDPKVRAMIAWMDTLAIPTPTYGISYPLPQPNALAMPATPLTQPAIQLKKK